MTRIPLFRLVYGHTPIVPSRPKETNALRIAALVAGHGWHERYVHNCPSCAKERLDKRRP